MSTVLIVDDDLTAHVLTHLRRDLTSDEIGRATGREADDEPHRLARRPLRRMSGDGHEEHARHG